MRSQTLAAAVVAIVVLPMAVAPLTRQAAALTLCVHERSGRVRAAEECRRHETAHQLPSATSAPEQHTFAVAMVVGDPEIVIGSNGPLEAVARCFPSPASGLPRSRLFMRSSVEGWAITQAVDPTRFNLFDLPAGEQAIGGVTNSGPEIDDALGASAIAPDGSVLTVAGDSVLVAMNILAGFDCVMTGVVTEIKVPIGQ